MNSEQIHRDIGRVEGEVKALRRDVDAINSKLDAVLARQYRMIGGSAALSGMATFAIAWFTK